jgi:hypothetical protein
VVHPTPQRPTTPVFVLAVRNIDIACARRTADDLMMR